MKAHRKEVTYVEREIFIHSSAGLTELTLNFMSVVQVIFYIRESFVYFQSVASAVSLLLLIFDRHFY